MSRACWPKSTRSRCAREPSARIPSSATCGGAARGTGGGAVRASLGIGSGIDDIDALAEALEALMAERSGGYRRARRSGAHSR